MFYGEGSTIFVEGASHRGSASGADVGIDHCTTDVLVSEEFLHRTDIVAVFQEVGREQTSTIGTYHDT